LNCDVTRVVDGAAGVVDADAGGILNCDGARVVNGAGTEDACASGI